MTDYALDRPLPADVDTERSILGAVLLDNDCLDQAAAKIQPEHFSLSSHQMIFKCMVDLWEADKPIDFNTLTNELGMHKQIQAVGGVAYVTDLTNGLPRVKNILHHVNIVKDKAVLRKLIQICNATVAASYEQEDTANRIASYHDEALMELIGEQSGESKHVSEFSEEVINQIYALRSQGHRLAGFSYGVEDLDFKTTGIRRKEFTIIGGRPKDGKTALLLEGIAANCAEGVAVGMFSIEMNREAILERLYASVAKIDYGHIRVPHLLTDEESVRLMNAKQIVDGWPLYIDDDAEITSNELCARARLMKKRYGVDLIGVDYMQLMNGTGDMRMRMIKISRALRTLAKTQGMAVIALSQLARPNDKNQNRRPEIWDLKESGSLEADANTILLIFRPVDETGKKTGEDEILITQRSGEAGICAVTYMGRWMRFEDRSMRGF